MLVQAQVQEGVKPFLFYVSINFIGFALPVLFCCFPYVFSLIQWATIQERVNKGVCFGLVLPKQCCNSVIQAKQPQPHKHYIRVYGLNLGLSLFWKDSTIGLLPSIMYSLKFMPKAFLNGTIFFKITRVNHIIYVSCFGV